MKLYLAPGACSLADHIAMREAGLNFEAVRVDLQKTQAETGEDFKRINPKGYVPALVLDDGQVLTENAAILAWVAERDPALAPTGDLGRVRLIEMLSYIEAEVHKPFLRVFFSKSEEEKAFAREYIEQRFSYFRESLQGEYLFGNAFSVADAFLYVMLRWATAVRIRVPESLSALHDRVGARPAVQATLRDEGLIEKAATA
jgi:glutathione S-transferase